MLLAVLTGTPSAQAAEFALSQSPDSIYFTLKPHAPVTNDPVLTAGGEASYVSAVFRAALREGHRLGETYLKDGLPRAYYAFLVSALQVPEHESKWQQIRRIAKLGARCSSGSNTGSRIKAVSAKAYQTFRESMQTQANPLVSDCASYAREAAALQLLGSHDALSTGYMQMTMNWHAAHYTSGNFLHAQAAINDGLKYYQTGFTSVLRNPRKYACVLTGKEPAEPVNYVTLIRATWAGQYNSGNLSKACRFVNDPSSPWVQGNDVPFRENLEDLLAGRNVLAKFLKGEDLAALQELIARFKGQDVPTPALAKVLGGQVDNPGDGGTGNPVPVPAPIEVTDLARDEFVVQPIALNARTQPNAWSPIVTTLLQGAIVRQLGVTSGWTRLSFAGATVYVNSSYLGRTQPFSMKAKVTASSFVNLRESAPSGKIAGSQANGKILTVLGSKKFAGQDYSWLQVESPWHTPGEKSFWVYSRYVKVTKTPVQLVRVPE